MCDIYISRWEEMLEYAGPQTCAAMTRRYDLILEHETKHHDQFKEYYADPLRHAIDTLNVTYRFEYCSLAFDLSDARNAQDRALEDAGRAWLRRKDVVDRLVDSWEVYETAALALDDVDYQLIDSAMPTNLRIRD